VVKKPPSLSSARWSVRTKRMVTIFVTAVLAFALFTFFDIIPMLVVSVLLSYLLWPLVNFFDERIFGFLPFKIRSMSVLLAFSSFIMSIVVAFIVVIPVLVDQLAEVGRNLPTFFEDIEVELEAVLSRPISFNGNPILIDGEPVIPLDRIEQVIGEDGLDGMVSSGDFDFVGLLGNFLGTLTGPAFSVLGGAINIAVNLSFIVLIIFYLMRDGDKFIGHMVNLTPPSYQGDMRRLLYELGRVWNAYLRGQLILSVVVGSTVYIAALLLGLPSAPILGLLAGLLEFIPNLGPFLALIPAALIALVSQSTTLPFLSGLSYALVVIIVWTGIQQLEAMYLVPRVMGGSLDLHPVVVLIAVLAGAGTGGALGVILAAPFTATARVFGQYLYGKLFDFDPFPTPKPYEMTVHRTPVSRLYSGVQSLFRRKTIEEKTA
jgi:predicted PurR-regulated permease PerM